MKINFQRNRTKTCIITAELVKSGFYQENCQSQHILLSHIGSELKEKLARNWTKTSLNFDTFYLRPLRTREVKKVSNG